MSRTRSPNSHPDKRIAAFLWTDISSFTRQAAMPPKRAAKKAAAPKKKATHMLVMPVRPKGQKGKGMLSGLLASWIPI